MDYFGITIDFIILFAIIALFILYFKWLIEKEETNEKSIKEYGKYLEKQIEETGFNADVKYSYENQKSGTLIVFSVDEPAETILIMNSRKQCDLMKFSEVIGYEVVEDNQIVGGISRAIAGGIMAGGAGAIVGANTAHKKQVNSLNVVIYLENIKSPKYIIAFNATNMIYSKAAKFSDDVGSTLKAIISINNKQNVK